MCNISILHRSIDGNIGQFHFLDIVSRAGMNMDMQVSLQQHVDPWTMCPGVSKLGHMEIIFLAFW